MDRTEESFTAEAGSRHRASALGPGSSADVRQAIQDVASSLEQLFRIGSAYVGRRAEENPYAVLGIAAGLGFVLGGGLASRLGGKLATFGSRMLLSQIVDTWLEPGGSEP